MTVTTATTAPATAGETTTDAAEVTFHVAPGNLDRALRIAALAAANDAMLPILTSVALTVTEAGNLVAMATDRYKLVRAAVMPTTGKDEDLTLEVAGLSRPAVLPLAEVKTLNAWLKPLVKALAHWGALEVTVTGRTSYEPGRLTLTSPLGGSYVVNLLDGDYPKIGGLLKDWTAGDSAALFALNPAYLETVAKMGKLGCERNTPMVWQTGATAGKPVQFKGGSSEGLVFEGLIMPVRLSSWTDGTDAPTGL